MVVVDKVLFTLPNDPEMLFPAVAVMQAYVNGFEQRSKMDDVSSGTTDYALDYVVEVNTPWWHAILNAGLVLKQKPVTVLPHSTDMERLNGYDMHVDLRDERLLMHIHSGKHVSKICGMYATGECPLAPLVKQVKCRLEDMRWRTVIGSTDISPYPEISLQELIDVQDNEVTGVVGMASPMTYLAASMGVAVVEVIPADRPVNWLAKWFNAGYRVTKDHKYIQRGVASVERSMAHFVSSKVAV